MSLITKIFGTQDERDIKALNPIVRQINELEQLWEKKSDTELKEHILSLKGELKTEKELNEKLPEVFAIVREASKRSMEMRPFDVQLIGGITLHQGKIAEMKTGEGKTLAATMPVILNALTGKGVHVVTVNDYLARRDAEWMEPLYGFLGLTVGFIQSGQSTQEKKEAYEADITYGTNNEFGFDYLRDNMVQEKEEKTQRPFHYAIVDEVDSILIDEARTPLIISAPDSESTKLYARFYSIIQGLKENTHYNKDDKTKSVLITDTGIDEIEKRLGITDLYQERGIKEVHHLEQALKAQVMYQRDKDYVVKDGEVMIVDEFTGRLMQGRRYSGGLHQAIEAKEGVPVQQESKTMATITFQNFFRMYEKLAGMTGTAATSKEEFEKVYGLEVLIIPTNKPIARKDLSDRVYATEAGKLKAIAQEIKKRNEKGQPVLVGTIAIEKSELLSNLLKANGVKHEILNAKQHEREAEIVANAGQKGAVTIATNMAGRGTDIKLTEEVKRLGGLHILGTERHEARRIDNQLRGRSGRQGDAGSSQFFVSMEDELMRVFGSDRIRGMMQRLGLPEDQAIQNTVITRSIAKAQEKVEGHNFDIRKHVLQYDDIMNKQRDAIYKQRIRILDTYENEKTRPELKEIAQEYMQERIAQTVETHTQVKPWNTKEIQETMRAMLIEDTRRDEKIKELLEGEDKPENRKQETIEFLNNYQQELYNRHEEQITAEQMRKIEKAVMLRTIDLFWLEHLHTMTQLRDAVRLRSYGQRDPLIEYKREGFQLFTRLLQDIQAEIANTILKVNFTKAATPAIDQKKLSTNNPDGPAPKKQLKSDKVGRNEPCPCGSGKKYKKCHGKA